MSISGTVPHMIVVFGTHVYMCKMMISLAVFSFFNYYNFLGFRGRGVKGQTITHYYQSQSATLYISTTIDHTGVK